LEKFRALATRRGGPKHEGVFEKKKRGKRASWKGALHIRTKPKKRRSKRRKGRCTQEEEV